MGKPSQLYGNGKGMTRTIALSNLAGVKNICFIKSDFPRAE
jgi:hypothetical protein